MRRFFPGVSITISDAICARLCTTAASKMTVLG